MKTDARGRYTRMRIREAFLKYLEKKPVSKITVKEICNTAEINRATFYKHYADPFNLLEKMEEELLEELRTEIRDYRKRTAQGLLSAILCSMKDKENAYTLIASENGDPSFAAHIADLFYREFRPGIAQDLPCCTETQQDTVFLFIVGGCGHLISEWIRSGMQVPPEQVAAELDRMCSAFIRAVKYYKE